MFKVIGLFLFAVVSFGGVNALAFEKETLLAHFQSVKPFVEECSEKHGMYDDETDDFKPCFLSCYYKKLGAFNEEGKLNGDVILSDLIKSVTKKEDIATYEDIVQQCMSVNNQEVSDVTAGCERAKLFMDCLEKKQSAVSTA